MKLAALVETRLKAEAHTHMAIKNSKPIKLRNTNISTVLLHPSICANLAS
jgi:hypothetical protein